MSTWYADALATGLALTNFPAALTTPQHGREQTSPVVGGQSEGEAG